jgi:hypothetical protein
MPRPRPVLAAEPIVEALRSAMTVREAARALGMPLTSLRRHCDLSDDAVLSRAYLDCCERGGSEKCGTKLPKPKTWAVICKTPSSGPPNVQIWTVEALTGDEALELATKRTGRTNLTIVEVAKR